MNANNIRFMQSFVANITGRAERKTLNGREYLVVPVSMIVPGVLAGSKGPLYYPQERVARNAAEWDGFPVTLGHPSHVLTNEPLSAADDGVLDRVGMGVLRNSVFSGGKLRSQAWLDAERTRKIAPQVYNAALEGRMVEVSTGLFTQEVARNGSWNGRSYTHEVVDYKPDHLAILVDQRGACSVKDGCGMNVHNASTENSNPEGINQYTHSGKSDADISKDAQSKTAAVSSASGKGITAAHKEAAMAHRDAAKHYLAKGDTAKASAHSKLAVKHAEEFSERTKNPQNFTTKNESTCPCGGTCRVCVANAVAMPKGQKPVKAKPAAAADSAEAKSRVESYQASAATPKSPTAPSIEEDEPVENDDVSSAPTKTPTPDVPAPTSTDTAPTSKAVSSPTAAGPTRGSGVEFDSYVRSSSSECPCGGECSSCQTKNSNPEGCNQYKSCSGGTSDAKEVDDSAWSAASQKARDAAKKAGEYVGYRSSTDARLASGKATSSTFLADRNGRAGHKTAMKDHVKAMHAHKEAASKALAKHDVDRFLAHTKAESAHREAAKFHQETGRSYVHNVGDGYGDAVESQPRCPIKQTFQPKGFVGKGRGDVHVAAKSGMAATGSSVAEEDHEDDETTKPGVTTQNQSDRDSSGLSSTEGEPMKRQEMIQHLTTNCSCHKGKAAQVALNAMTDEQLADLIVNAQVVAQAREFIPNGASLATNAMPAALMAAIKKKKGEEDPEEEEDDEDEAPAKVPPQFTKNSMTTEEWLKTAPPEVRRIVRNNLARERQAKDQLIGVLVGNVQDGPAKDALVNNYRRLDVEVLKAQVDALPTTNRGGEFDIEDVGGPIFDAASLSGHDRGVTRNRFSGNGEVVIEEPMHSGRN